MKRSVSETAAVHKIGVQLFLGSTDPRRSFLREDRSQSDFFTTFVTAHGRETRQSLSEDGIYLSFRAVSQIKAEVKNTVQTKKKKEETIISQSVLKSVGGDLLHFCGWLSSYRTPLLAGEDGSRSPFVSSYISNQDGSWFSFPGCVAGNHRPKHLSKKCLKAD